MKRFLILALFLVLMLGTVFGAAPDGVEDWEDGDVQGWNGDTGVWSAQQSVVAEGSYAGEMTYSGSDVRTMSYPFSQSYSPDSVEFYVWVDGSTSNAKVDHILYSGSSAVFQIRTEPNNNYMSWNAGQQSCSNSETTLVDPAGSTWHHVEVKNINWSNNEADVYVNGNLKGSDLKFCNSASSIDKAELLWNNGGNGFTAYSDYFRWANTDTDVVIRDLSTSPNTWKINEAVDVSYDITGNVSNTTIRVFNQSDGSLLKEENFTYNRGSVEDTRLDWFTPSEYGSYLLNLTAVSTSGNKTSMQISKDLVKDQVPVLLYGFDRGCPVDDLSGNNRDGECVNGPTTGIDSVFGDAFSFTSDSRVVDSNFNVSGSFTISAFARASGDVEAGLGQLISKRASWKDNNIGIRLNDLAGGWPGISNEDGNPDIACILQNNGDQRIAANLDSTAGYNWGEWGRFSCVYNKSSSTLKAVFNGTVVAETSQTAGTPKSIQNWTIGANSKSPSAENFNGDIDDAYVFNEALNPSNIGNLNSSENTILSKIVFSDKPISVGSKVNVSAYLANSDNVDEVTGTVYENDTLIQDNKSFTANSADNYSYQNLFVFDDEYSDYTIQIKAFNGSQVIDELNRTILYDGSNLTILTPLNRSYNKLGIPISFSSKSSVDSKVYVDGQLVEEFPDQQYGYLSKRLSPGIHNVTVDSSGLFKVSKTVQFSVADVYRSFGQSSLVNDLNSSKNLQVSNGVLQLSGDGFYQSEIETTPAFQNISEVGVISGNWSNWNFHEILDGVGGNDAIAFINESWEYPFKISVDSGVGPQWSKCKINCTKSSNWVQFASQSETVKGGEWQAAEQVNGTWYVIDTGGYLYKNKSLLDIRSSLVKQVADRQILDAGWIYDDEKKQWHIYGEAKPVDGHPTADALSHWVCNSNLEDCKNVSYAVEVSDLPWSTGDAEVVKINDHYLLFGDALDESTAHDYRQHLWISNDLYNWTRLGLVTDVLGGDATVNYYPPEDRFYMFTEYTKGFGDGIGTRTSPGLISENISAELLYSNETQSGLESSVEKEINVSYKRTGLSKFEEEASFPVSVKSDFEQLNISLSSNHDSDVGGFYWSKDKIYSKSSSDTTPPTSSDIWTASGFVDKTMTVEFTSTDSGSGVANQTICINGSCTTYSGSSHEKTFDSSGTYNIDYSATDKDGNKESNNSETVKIDKEVPGLGSLPKNQSFTYPNDWTGVDYNGSDQYSGISSYKINDSKFTINSTGFLDDSQELSAGTYNLEVNLTDNAGNSNTTVYKLTVEKGQPNIDIVFSGNGQTVTNDNYTISDASTLNASAVINVSKTGQLTDANFNLYRNSSEVGTLQTGYVQQVNNSLVTGKYYFNSTFTSNENYTSVSRDPLVTVEPAQGPSFTINSPVDGKTYNFTQQETVEIDLNVSNSSFVDLWKYSNDSKANVTFTPNTTLTGFSEGDHNTTVWANDSNGDYTSGTSGFTVAVNDDPSASFIYSVNDLTVDVDASGSSDSDGSISQYEWDWTSDGTYEDSGKTASHTYSSGGDYTIQLRVTDDDGATDTGSNTVSVSDDSGGGSGGGGGGGTTPSNSPPSVTIYMPENSNYTKDNIPYKFEPNDPDENLDTCEIYIDDNNPQTVSCDEGLNSTGNLSTSTVGEHRFYVNVSDTDGAYTYKFQDFKAYHENIVKAENSSGSRLSNFTVNFKDSGDTVLGGSSVNGRYVFNTTELLNHDKVTLEIVKKGFNINTEKLDINTSFELNKTYQLSFAKILLSAKDVGNLNNLRFNVTTSNSRTFKNFVHVDREKTSLNLGDGDTGSTSFEFRKNVYGDQIHVNYYVNSYAILDEDVNATAYFADGTQKNIDTGGTSVNKGTHRATTSISDKIVEKIIYNYDIGDCAGCSYDYDLNYLKVNNSQPKSLTKNWFTWEKTGLASKKIEFEFKAKDYKPRTYFREWSGYKDLNITAYMLKNKDGQVYPGVKVKNITDFGIPNTKVTLTRSIQGKERTIAEKKTTSSGSASLFVQPSKVYEVTAEKKPEYVTKTETYSPSANEFSAKEILLRKKKQSGKSNLYLFYSDEIFASCSNNKTAINCSYRSSSDDLKKAELTVSTREIIQNQFVDNDSNTAQSGDLLVKGLNTSNETYHFKVTGLYPENTKITATEGNTGQEKITKFGAAGIFLTLIMVLTVSSATAFNTKIGIAAATGSLIFSGMLGLIVISPAMQATLIAVAVISGLVISNGP